MIADDVRSSEVLTVLNVAQRVEKSKAPVPEQAQEERLIEVLESVCSSRRVKPDPQALAAQVD